MLTITGTGSSIPIHVHIDMYICIRCVCACVCICTWVVLNKWTNSTCTLHLDSLGPSISKGVKYAPFASGILRYTPPKINMSPERGPFYKENSLPTITFQGIC